MDSNKVESFLIRVTKRKINIFIFFSLFITSITLLVLYNSDSDQLIIPTSDLKLVSKIIGMDDPDTKAILGTNAEMAEAYEIFNPYKASTITTHNRENATLISLVRNSELQGMIYTIKSVEKRFNERFHYDWIFMNDEPFTAEFKEEVSKRVSGQAIFTTIPSAYWAVPESIDKGKMQKAMARLVTEHVLYAEQISYRQMCRFNSGFFYKMKIMNNYQYYWRVEPKTRFDCDLLDDPFTTMRTQNKKYGFNMALTENRKTIRQLWQTTMHFFNKVEPDLKDPSYSLDFIQYNTDTKSVVPDHYNLCHFWSNFEIADLSFFRSEGYNKYFEHLDKTGNFFYERWGDAPIHTLAVSYLLSPDQLHYFEDTGYFHKPNQNCPKDDGIREALHCSCSKSKDFTMSEWSCLPRFFTALDLPFPLGYDAPE